MRFIKIWTNFGETISPLTDAEKGRLLDAMLIYAEYGTEPESFTGNERFLWPSVRQSIDRMAESSEKCRENGRKGGRPAGQKNREAPEEAAAPDGENRTEPEESEKKPAEPDESEEKPSKANESEKKPTKADESQKEKREEEKKREETKEKVSKRKAFAPPSPEEVAAYCREHGLPVDPDQFCSYYDAVGWMVGSHRMKDWQACLRAWAARERNRPQQSRLPPGDIRAYSQRDCTGEQELAIERMMAAAAAGQAKGASA